MWVKYNPDNTSNIICSAILQTAPMECRLKGHEGVLYTFAALFGSRPTNQTLFTNPKKRKNSYLCFLIFIML